MSKSKEEIANATLITNAEYAQLKNPEFEGQTRQDQDGNYKMYWSENGVLYYTVNNIMS